ncbi:MAG: ABC transporter substrate-binding protein [Treponema sp.]
MKRLFSAVLITAVFAACFTGCSKKETTGGMTLDGKTLKIGVNIAYPPFEYYDSDGKTPLGFDVGLGKAVAAKLGLEPDIIDVAWEGIFAGLDTDKYDCVISAVTITDERTASYEFSKPYIGNGQSMILLKNSKVVAKTPQDLGGLKVGYLTESTSDVYMTKLAKEGLKFEAEEYDDEMNAFADLKAGRCDAVISDSLVATDYVKKPDSPFALVWEGPAEEYFGIACKKGNTNLRSAIDKALDELTADGTLKDLSMKNFGIDIVSNISK